MLRRKGKAHLLYSFSPFPGLTIVLVLGGLLVRRGVSVAGQAVASPSLELCLEHPVDAVRLREVLQKGDEVEELAVVHVVEPGRHGNLENGPEYCFICFDFFSGMTKQR